MGRKYEKHDEDTNDRCSCTSWHWSFCVSVTGGREDPAAFCLYKWKGSDITAVDADAATAATTAVSGSFSFSAAAADGEMDAVSAADRTGISRDCGAANGRPFCSFSLYFLLSEACFLFFSSRTPHRSRRQHFHL